MILRKCSCCGKYLPTAEFKGKDFYCRTCRRDYNWQYKYGISPEQYAELNTKQNYKCAICGKTLENGYFHVDHNKETGEIRGLLCHECNTGIGLFKENIDSLINAIEYLTGDNNG